MAFSFIHTGDLHLDSPLTGLAALEDERTDAIAHAGRRALEDLVDIAIERKVDAFLIAGDLWDGDWRDVSAGLFVQDQARRLRDQGIGVFAVLGNHDAASRVTDRIRHLDTIHVFSPDAPESVLCGDAVIHGMSFAHREVRENLASQFPPAVPGRINVGLLHTGLDGRGGHDRYAPCEPADLLAKRYHYFALGHVHTRMVVASGTAAEGGTIAYCGVLQGRHARETGVKGAYLVRIEGNQAALEPLDIHHVEWFHEDVDLSGGEAAEDAIGAALDRLAGRSSSRLSVLRLRLIGERRDHHSFVARRSALTAMARDKARFIGGGEILLEKLLVETTPPREAPPPLPRGFERYLHDAGEDADVAAAATGEIEEVLKAVAKGSAPERLYALMPALGAYRDAGSVDALLRAAAERVAARLREGENP